MSDFTTWRSLVDGEEIGVIPDSVESHWPVGSDDTSTATDTVGDIDLAVNGPTLVTDSDSADGHHYSLDGSDYLGLDDTDDDEIFKNLDEFTMLLWVLAEDDQEFEFRFFGHMDNDGSGSASNNSWMISVVDSEDWRVQISDEVVFSGDYTNDILTAEWLLLTLRFDEGSMDLLKNDANEIDSGTASASNTGDNGDQFAIGSHPNGDGGLIGDVDFGGWAQTAISDEDITQYYNAHPRSD